MQYNPIYDRATPGLWRSPNGAFIPLRALIMRSLMLRLLPLSFLTTACSPLASSPFDAKYQLELTLHVVQTNLDDLRHDISCFQTELQILDSRMKQSEAVTQTLKVQDLQQLVAHVRSLDQKLARVEKIKENQIHDLEQLTPHANETTLALTLLKKKLDTLEGELLAVRHSHSTAVPEAALYTVKAGDSLEKIARLHKTSVEEIKKINRFEQDLIVVGQILKIPSDSTVR